MIATYRRLQEMRANGEIEEGFTLIELLIVIVVLGILAAVVVFSLGGVAGQSAQAACKSDFSSINTALAAAIANGTPAATIGAAGTTGGTYLVGPTLYLASWPTSSHYTMTLNASGGIQVGPGATAGTTAYTTAAAACIPANVS
jgi:general secretion pathway protein G